MRYHISSVGRQDECKAIAETLLGQLRATRVISKSAWLDDVLTADGYELVINAACAKPKNYAYSACLMPDERNKWRYYHARFGESRLVASLRLVQAMSLTIADIARQLDQ
jgi:hypothetical protein